VSLEVSIIVPTHDRPADLRTCLSAIASLEAAPGSYEVIVVDDGSGPETLREVERAASAGLALRYERLEGSGLQAARDRGAAAASAPVLAYLDDDAAVSATWLTALVASRRRWGWSGAGGAIRLQLAGPAPRWLDRELRHGLSELDFGPEPRLLAPDEHPYGANCAVTHEAYVAAGGFRSGLDRQADSLLSNGEIDFFERVRAAHGPLAWIPEAVVQHRIPAERLTVSYHRRRARAQGVSDERMRPTVGFRARTLRTGREVVRFALNVVSAVLKLSTRRPAVAHIARAEYALGRLRGVIDPRFSPR